MGFIKVTGPKRVDLDLPLPCPNCGREVVVKARSAAPGSKVKCSACGVDIELTGDDLRKAQAAMDRLVSAIHRLGR